MTLNERAANLVDALVADAAGHRVAVHIVGGARVVDCGIDAPGGLLAGLALARVCLADLASVALVDRDGLTIQVVTDQPVRACLGSQYAGWNLSVGKFFAMGSGPMRARFGHESLYREHPELIERSPCAVGVLETRKMPTEDVVAELVGKLGLEPEQLTLLVAPTASLAGTVQVVARTLETALHKLHTLHFDLGCVVSGAGVAPLPPVAKTDLAGIGWTNDAVLYGGRATLWVRADDAVLSEIGRQVPAMASGDYGAPFAEIFERAGRDFYKIDPHLFSPAQIVFHNLNTGRTHSFGRLAPEVLARSFSV